MKNILKIIEGKKQRLDAHLPISKDLVKNSREWFKIELTYTSNAIEGNTLSRAETALVVKDGLTVENKTLVEHLEAVNHGEAIDWIMEKIDKGKQAITKKIILDLHQHILQKIDDTNAGRFRNVSVRIAGTTVILPNPAKVPELMDKFVWWLQNSNINPVTLAIEAHFKLVSIHPFVDGNGRTARLLMNFILLQAGYPPAIIRKEDRKQYLNSIEKAQLGGSLANYQVMMYEAVDRCLDIYLEMVEDRQQNKTSRDVINHVSTKNNLLKIGELAKLTGETVPTIRHWTMEKLLEVADYSKGGYQLYDQKMVAVVSKIRELQRNKRLTLAEIKKIDILYLTN